MFCGKSGSCRDSSILSLFMIHKLWRTQAVKIVSLFSQLSEWLFGSGSAIASTYLSGSQMRALHWPSLMKRLISELHWNFHIRDLIIVRVNFHWSEVTERLWMSFRIKSPQSQQFSMSFTSNKNILNVINFIFFILYIYLHLFMWDVRYLRVGLYTSDFILFFWRRLNKNYVE